MLNLNKTPAKSTAKKLNFSLVSTAFLVVAGVGITMATQVIGAPATPTSPAVANTLATSIVTVPGMPPVIDPRNLYSENGSTHLSPVVSDHLDR